MLIIDSVYVADEEDIKKGNVQALRKCFSWGRYECQSESFVWLTLKKQKLKADHDHFRPRLNEFNTRDR